MQIKFADTFFDSLKRLNQTRNPLHWRYYDEFFHKVRWFFRNLGFCLKQAWTYRPWSFDIDTYDYFMVHLKRVRNSIYNGHEVRESANVKIKNIERCIRIVRRLKDELVYTDIAVRCLSKEDRDKYTPLSFGDLLSGKKQDEESDRIDYEVIKHRQRLEQQDWETLWTIIKDDAQGWWD